MEIDWIELSPDDRLAVDFYFYRSRVGNDPTASALNDIVEKKIAELERKRVRGVIRDTVNRKDGIELLKAAAALKIPLERLEK